MRMAMIGTGYVGLVSGACFHRAALRRADQDRGDRHRRQRRAQARDADKVVTACGGSLDGKTVAVLGLTFKPDTDDMRDAPSLAILPALEAQGARVRAYNPRGMPEARRLMPRLEIAADPYACVQGADAMSILTERDQLRALDLDLDLDRVTAALRSPVIVDQRNIYKPGDATAKGFTYVSVGRG